jgi:choline dehydrogenase-like flavoprotein
MDHPVFEVAVYDSGLETRPGYGDSAQTGMLLSFFERVAEDLPVSIMGEIRPVALALNAGEMTRDVLVRDLIRHTLRTHGRSGFRERFTQAFAGTLDLYFAVEVQPLPHHRIGIDRIEATGQAIPKIEQDYPSYFGACVERVLGRFRERVRRSAVVKHVSTFPSSYHWVGATRMSERDATGCVDPHLRYHGLENLYVLSTGVFPSSSSANPTLTLAALALRLGDRLAASAGRV